MTRIFLILIFLLSLKRHKTEISLLELFVIMITVEFAVSLSLPSSVLVLTALWAVWIDSKLPVSNVATMPH